MSDERVLAVLEEMLAWTKVQALPAARAALAQALPKAEHRLVYQASTGPSTTVLAKQTGISDFTVRSIWKRCYRSGLMREDPKNPGRFLRSFDLEDFEMMPTGLAKTKDEPEAVINAP